MQMRLSKSISLTEIKNCVTREKPSVFELHNQELIQSKSNLNFKTQNYKEQKYKYLKVVKKEIIFIE
jgi:hypothetical protein